MLIDCKPVSSSLFLYQSSQSWQLTCLSEIVLYPVISATLKSGAGGSYIQGYIGNMISSCEMCPS